MSKLLATVAALVVMLVLAAPAGAQRDPFEPLVKPGGSASVNDSPDADGGVQPIPADVGASGALATTGSDASTWIALAYGLIGIGGAALLLAYARRAPG